MSDIIKKIVRYEIMKKYATIILPRELEKNAVEDIQKMKKTIEKRYDLEIEVVIEEGKQRE